MKPRQLGNLTVSEIGMGCMGFSHGYGPVPERDYSIAAIRQAFEYGCTFLIQLRSMVPSNFTQATMSNWLVRP